MFHRIFTFFCIILLLSGCVAKRKFIYNHPANQTAYNTTNLVAAVAPVIDERHGNNEIDQIYIENPLLEIQTIIKEELLSTGIFQKVIIVSDDSTELNADILIEPSLVKLNWEVPDYEEMLGKVFAISFFTGGIGGIIYGNTDTDVHGDVTLHIRVLTQDTSSVYIDKTYDNRCTECMIKFECDTPETKAKLIGKSLKKNMEAIKTDLVQVFSSPNRKPLTSEDSSVILTKTKSASSSRTVKIDN